MTCFKECTLTVLRLSTRTWIYFLDIFRVESKSVSQFKPVCCIRSLAMAFYAMSMLY